MNLIGWRHPYFGQISEIICPRHESEVLAAFRLLGIGSDGQELSGAHRCTRCDHAG